MHVLESCKTQTHPLWAESKIFLHLNLAYVNLAYVNMAFVNQPLSFDALLNDQVVTVCSSPSQSPRFKSLRW